MVTDWRARVLDVLEREADELVRFLSAQVAVPSVSGTDGENIAQRRFAAVLAEQGLDIDNWRLPLPALLADPEFPGMEVPRDEAWGLIGRLPGSGGGRSLLFDGHLDVVPPGDPAAWSADPFSGAVRGGRVYGRGACDMKGGLVAALWAVRALRVAQVPLRGDVLLASVQGEEDGGLGTFGLLRRGWRAEACIVPEPTGLDLVPATAGSLTFRLRVPGSATHASQRTAGVSAIEKFWPVWRALADLEARRNAATDPLFDRWELAYPLSIGTLRCGDWASSVPDLLVADGRLGVALDEPLADAQAALEHAVAAACDGDPWLRDHPVTVQWWGGRFASCRLPESSDLADRVAAAHRAVGGGAQRTWGAPYGSDLRLLTNIGGIPTVHYGPGDVALAHGPDESVPVAEVLTCARSLAVCALEFCL